MKRFAATLLAWLLPLPLVIAQPVSVSCIDDTRENTANLIFPANLTVDLDGAQLDDGDVLTAHSPDGRCVGQLSWINGESQSLTLRGDDTFSEDADGLRPGDPLLLRIYRPGGVIYRAGLTLEQDVEPPSCPEAVYAANCVYEVTSLFSNESAVLEAKVYLEGAYRNGQMSTTLNADGVLPTTQPFAEAAFEGTVLEYELALTLAEDYFDTRPDLVDFVLIELRTAPEAASRVGRRVALLHKDGRLVDFDGQSPVSLAGFDADRYYTVIRHRNHLPAMSASAVDFSSGVGQWDFTDDLANAFGSNALADLGDGNYGLYAADPDVNGQIQASDANLQFLVQVGQAGYRQADYDLNGQVQASDSNLLFLRNVGRGSSVPE